PGGQAGAGRARTAEPRPAGDFVGDLSDAAAGAGARGEHGGLREMGMMEVKADGLETSFDQIDVAADMAALREEVAGLRWPGPRVTRAARPRRSSTVICARASRPGSS